jgi:hypothetical protein
MTQHGKTVNKRTHNALVPGSSPGRPTKLFRHLFLNCRVIRFKNLELPNVLVHRRNCQTELSKPALAASAGWILLCTVATATIR